MLGEERITTYCGLDCTKCDYKEKCNCGGCVATKGNPFNGKCELASCAISKGRRFCGECEKFPCELLNKFSFDKEQGDNGARIENCKKLKNEFVKEGRAGLNPVCYCGLHCDFCFLGQWCGGCRSDYNCCSFATLFEDKKCPNATCCNEKKIKGCWECEELKSCNKGFFKNNNAFTMKAYCLFIKKYGEQVYSETIKNATANGVDYAKDFDTLGSTEKVLEELEKYRR